MHQVVYIILVFFFELVLDAIHRWSLIVPAVGNIALRSSDCVMGWTTAATGQTRAASAPHPVSIVIGYYCPLCVYQVYVWT